MDSIAKELVPFHTGVMIVEPGGARTEFRFGSSKLANEMDVYDGTPASMVRGIKDASHPSPGDPAPIVKIMINSADQVPAPSRIAFGTDSYAAIHKTLTERLAVLEEQKALAATTDSPKVA